MLRRSFFKLTGMGVLSLPLMRSGIFDGEAPGPREALPWNHGSPYVGHADKRPHFRGLAPDQIMHEMAHFRTEEPWRRKIVFGL